MKKTIKTHSFQDVFGKDFKSKKFTTAYKKELARIKVIKKPPTPITMDAFLAIIADHQPHEFFLLLNYGLRSNKTVTLLKNGKLRILNHIDNSTITITKDDLAKEYITLIGSAITKKAFFSYDEYLARQTIQKPTTHPTSGRTRKKKSPIRH